MARATSTGEHVVLVLTRTEALAVERCLSSGSGAVSRPLRPAARRALRALGEGRLLLRAE